MGKDKLRKWKENAAFSHVFEPDLKDIVGGATLNRGQWAKTVFGNDRPITLELGCGKGEYTVGLARRHPERTPFGPYAAALPADPPPSPIFFPDEKLEALLPYLPLSLVDDIDAARQEMYTLWDVATAVMERVKVDGEPAAAPSQLPRIDAACSRTLRL